MKTICGQIVFDFSFMPGTEPEAGEERVATLTADYRALSSPVFQLSQHTSKASPGLAVESVGLPLP